jgi:hypothetical protein
MEEEWKIIEGYPDYQISNFGRVKSFKRYPSGNKTSKKEKKIEKTSLFKN